MMVQLPSPHHKVAIVTINIPECSGCCASGGTSSYNHFSEYHGWDECPTVGNTECFGSPEGPASCANAEISGTLYSDVFYVSNIPSGAEPKADVYADFDDLGSITGASGSLSCDETEDCMSCGVGGTVTPFYHSVGTNRFRLSINYVGKNAYWGGPYAIYVDAFFYYE